MILKYCLTILNICLMILKGCLMILKCFVYDFEKLFNDSEMFFNYFFNDLSRRSKNFERDTYKGGRGALTHRPPL